MNFYNLNILSRIKISYRVNLLAAIAVLATIVLSGAYFFGGQIMGREFQNQSEIGKLTELAQDVKVGALQMRRREKDFLLRKDTKYVKKYTVDEDRIQKALAQMAGLGVASAVEKNIEQLKAGITSHKDQFLKVFKLYETMGLNEKTGQQGQLRKAVHDVEDKLKTASLYALTVKMLMMRRHEKDFMLRGKKKYIGRIDKRREEFDVLLKETTLSGEVKTDLSSLMDAYQNGFRAYAKTAMILKAETRKLSQIFAEMAPNFEAIFKFTQANKLKSKTSLTASRSLTDNIFLTATVLILIMSTGLGLLIGRSITGPLRSLTSAMRQLADGDISTEIPNAKDTNEIGAMSKAVQVFKDNAIRNKELEAEQEEQKLRTEEEKRKMMHELADGFDANVGGIIDTVSSASTELNATAQTMSSIAEETSNQSAAVSAASEEAATNVQTVASASEEMSASIAEINQQVNQASEAAKQAVSEVEKTGSQMEALAATADKISGVIGMISEIAEQTNLLALNATIESARAGEAGKGFAVVASEVKGLAGQTAKATEEIVAQVNEIQEATKQAVVSMSDIGKIIKQVDETSAAIAAAMEEQGAATQEIARNVQEAASGTEEVTRNITGVNQASQEAGAASGQVMSAAGELSQQSEKLKEEVGKYLNQIRSA